ncbi:hypothetical protein C8R45DRAFT_1096901 [Mycena sanguinolenta]|nr:hypothetical protein C8R45DRAFT_1096901 [Mycena sanguinolenta]
MGGGIADVGDGIILIGWGSAPSLSPPSLLVPSRRRSSPRRHFSPFARPQADLVYSSQGQIGLKGPHHQQRALGFPTTFDTFNNILILYWASERLLLINTVGEPPSTPTTPTIPAELGRIWSNWLPLLQNPPSPLRLNAPVQVHGNAHAQHQNTTHDHTVSKVSVHILAPTLRSPSSSSTPHPARMLTHLYAGVPTVFVPASRVLFAPRTVHAHPHCACARPTHPCTSTLALRALSVMALHMSLAVGLCSARDCLHGCMRKHHTSFPVLVPSVGHGVGEPRRVSGTGTGWQVAQPAKIPSPARHPTGRPSP